MEGTQKSKLYIATNRKTDSHLVILTQCLRYPNLEIRAQ